MMIGAALLLAAASSALAQEASGPVLAIATRKDPNAPDTDPPLRRARNAYFNRGTMTFAENITASLLHIDTFSLATELPIKASTTIVAGTVSLAEAFPSSDETNVYSEYTVDVDRVLKDETPNTARIPTLVPGDRIPVLRLGGALRLWSGRVIPSTIQGQAQLQIGSRYVLFLSRVPDISAFLVQTAYLDKDGLAQSIDDAAFALPVHGKPVDAFLAEIERQLVPAGGPQ